VLGARITADDPESRSAIAIAALRRDGAPQMRRGVRVAKWRAGRKAEIRPPKYEERLSAEKMGIARLRVGLRLRLRLRVYSP